MNRFSTVQPARATLLASSQGDGQELVAIISDDYYFDATIVFIPPILREGLPQGEQPFSQNWGENSDYCSYCKTCKERCNRHDGFSYLLMPTSSDGAIVKTFLNSKRPQTVAWRPLYKSWARRPP